MTSHRIRAHDLVPGDPLPWDLKDESGQTAIGSGTAVIHDAALGAALTKGLFVDDPAYSPSVLRIINHVNRRLDQLLHRLPHEADAEASLLALADAVIAAVELNADVALACILLNQNAADYAIRHCVDTAVVSVMVARALERNRGEMQIIAAAALTMNVGMLDNQPQGTKEALSGTDMEWIRAHPQRGADLLREAGITDPDWLSYVLLHHENEDGSGYPLGKAGDDIPFDVKIISLADRYCARISSRNYRKSVLPDAALSDILIGDNASIDPMLTSCFIREFGIYPTGVLVRLANGEVAVVTRRGESTRAPYVKSLLAADGTPLPSPVERNTGAAGCAVKEMLTGEQIAISVAPRQLWGDVAAS